MRAPELRARLLNRLWKLPVTFSKKSDDNLRPHNVSRFTIAAY